MCSLSCAGFRRRFALLPSWQGSPTFTCTHASAAGTAKPMSASSFQRTYVLRTDVHLSFTTPSSGKNKRASLRMRNSQSCSRAASRHHTRKPERRSHRGTPHYRTAPRHTCAGFRVSPPPPHQRTSGKGSSRAVFARFVLKSEVGGGHTHARRVGTDTVRTTMRN